MPLDGLGLLIIIHKQLTIVLRLLLVPLRLIGLGLFVLLVGGAARGVEFE